VETREQTDTGEPRLREARLRSEYAHLYPPLEPGRWESAALMADRVVAWLLRQPNRGYVAPERVLRSDHFEFRGGTGKPASSGESHRRRDYPAKDS
jgi:hypothetical protein